MSKLVNVSFSDGDLKQIDAYCSCHNLTRSKFLIQSAMDRIEASNLVDYTASLLNIFGRFEVNKELTEDDKKLLDSLNIIFARGRKM